MIQNIGLYTDEVTGETQERFLIFGHLIKDGAMKAVGAKGTSMLSLSVSPGRGDELVNIKLWGYDAVAYDGLKRGSTVLADCILEQREYMGKTYKDYKAINFAVLGGNAQAGTHVKRAKKDPVEPEDPMAGFEDYQGSLPF